jgi:regulator of sigma E protease
VIDFIQSIIAFILALGILITFHEFGHYWVARKCNVKILKFSVGFGKSFWRFDFNQPFWHLGFTHSPWKLNSYNKLFKQREFSAEETEFVLSALPIGGYVKMLDEREGNVLKDEAQFAFNSKPLHQRLAIVLAGPIFNFIFAIFAYWLIYMIGVTGLKPVIDEVEPGSIAMQSGLESGHQILEIDGTKTSTWTSVIDRTVPNIVDAKDVIVKVINESQSLKYIELDLSLISIDDMASGRLLGQLGIKPRVPEYPAKLGELIAGGAAERAGLQSGDLVVGVDNNPIVGWVDWVEYVRSRPQVAMNVTIERDGNTRTIAVTPDAYTRESGEVIGRIGAAFDNNFEPDASFYTLENYTLLPAFKKAVVRTYEMSLMTLRILGKMIVGEASVKNLSGPITIAKYAGDTAELGIVAFFGFLAIVSVSLGVLNLLPVPLLDGGHAFYYLIEGIKGSPVSESFQVMGQQLGLVLLLGLMGIALYNDILRTIG